MMKHPLNSIFQEPMFEEFLVLHLLTYLSRKISKLCCRFLPFECHSGKLKLYLPMFIMLKCGYSNQVSALDEFCKINIELGLGLPSWMNIMQNFPKLHDLSAI